MIDVQKLTEEEVTELLSQINEREDFYCEWITAQWYSKEVIQKCKDWKYNLLDIETMLENEENEE